MEAHRMKATFHRCSYHADGLGIMTICAEDNFACAPIRPASRNRSFFPSLSLETQIYSPMVLSFAHCNLIGTLSKPMTTMTSSMLAANSPSLAIRCIFYDVYVPDWKGLTALISWWIEKLKKNSSTLLLANVFIYLTLLSVLLTSSSHLICITVSLLTKYI